MGSCSSMKIVKTPTGAVEVDNPTAEFLSDLSRVPKDHKRVEGNKVFVGSKYSAPFLSKYKNAVKEDPWSTLFLLPSAPVFVVEAVWRALANKYHPDKGGDVSLFRKFKEAYDKLREK